MFSTFLADQVTLPPWLDNLLTAVTNVIGPILVLVATAGIIYAVVVGIKFVKADEKNEREEAKAKLISVIVGIVVTGLLIALFYFLAAAFRYGWIDLKGWFNEDTGAPVSVSSTLQTYAGVVRSFFIR